MANYSYQEKLKIAQAMMGQSKVALTRMIESTNNSLNSLLADYVEERKRQTRRGWAMSVPLLGYNVVKGFFNSLVDFGGGLGDLARGLINNVGHIFDDEDGTDWKKDVGYMFGDFFTTLAEGTATGLTGIAADVGAMFGADTDWAYGKGGVLEEVEKLANDTRNSMLSGQNMLSKQNNFQSFDGSKNDDLVNARWTEADYSKKIAADFERSVSWRNFLKDKVIAGYLNAASFGMYEKRNALLEDNELYQQVMGAGESAGRIIATVLASKAMAKAGIPETVIKASSSAYFGVSIFGQSMEEALETGVSIQDAYTYATGVASIEMMTEQMFGVKPGQIPTSRNIWGILKTGFEEGVEEIVAELSQRAVNKYKDGEVDTSETPQELRQRVLYAGVTGALMGAGLGGGQYLNQNFTTSGQISKVKETLSVDVESMGKAKAQEFFNKDIDGAVDFFNSDFGGTLEEKQSIIKKAGFDQFVVYNEKTSKFELTEYANDMKTDIGAKQGDQSISKNTHAVGQNQFGVRYSTEIKDGVKIKIVSNERVSELSEKQQQVVDQVKRKNAPIAFFEVEAENVLNEGKINGYYDKETGMIFINIHSNKAVNSVYAHESLHRMVDMIKKGMVSKKSQKAFTKFIEELNSKGFQEYANKNGFGEIMQKIKERYSVDAWAEENIAFLIQEFVDSSSLMKNVYGYNAKAFNGFTNDFLSDSNIRKMQSVETNKSVMRAIRRVQNKFDKVIGSFGAVAQASTMADAFNNRVFQKYAYSTGDATVKQFSKVLKTNTLKTNINDFLPLKEDKKIYTHRAMNFHGFTQFLEYKKLPFASFFVENSNTVFPASNVFGNVHIIVNENFYKKISEKNALFLPSHVGEGSTKIKISDVWKDGVFVLSDAMENLNEIKFIWDRETKEVSIEDYFKRKKTALNAVSNYQYLIHLNAFISQYIDFHKRNLRGMRYGQFLASYWDQTSESTKGKSFESLESLNMFTNMINGFRDSQEVTPERFKKMNIKSESSEEIFNNDLEVIKEKISKLDHMFDSTVLVPTFVKTFIAENELPSYGSFMKEKASSILKQSYMVKSFWQMVAKIADGQSLVGDKFLNFYEKSSRKYSYPSKELVKDMEDFVISLYRSFSYYGTAELKADLEVEDIGLVIMVATQKSLTFPMQDLQKQLSSMGIDSVIVNEYYTDQNVDLESASNEKILRVGALNELKKGSERFNFSYALDGDTRIKLIDRWVNRGMDPKIAKEIVDFFDNFQVEDSNTHIKRVLSREAELVLRSGQIELSELTSMPQYKDALAHFGEQEAILYDKNSIEYKQAKRKFKNNGYMEYDPSIKRYRMTGKDFKHEKKAYIVIGLPGSGKSTSIVNDFSNVEKAFIADSDDIKPLFPDIYQNGKGAGRVHEVSRRILKDVLLEKAKTGVNMIIPVIGTESRINNLIYNEAKFHENGYDIYLIYNKVPETFSGFKATLRFFETGRMTPYEYLIRGKQQMIDKTFEQSEEYGIKDTAVVNNHVEYGHEPIVIQEPKTSYLKDLMEKRHENFLKHSKHQFSLDLDSGKVNDDYETQEDKQAAIASETKQAKYNFANDPKIESPFERAQKLAKKASLKTYKDNERIFSNSVDRVLRNAKQNKTRYGKIIVQLYNAWESYIIRSRRGDRITNHVASTVSKTIITELNALLDSIALEVKEGTRTEKKPLPVELQYIVDKVNSAIYSALDYMDQELKVPINVTKENPNGYLFTRGMHWYLRDMKAVEKWDQNTVGEFNKDKRGAAYRRLVNAILNSSNKGGIKELQQAVNHFTYATDVRPIVDLSLKQDQPRTAETVRKQWEQNTRNINTISNIIGYNMGINGIIDPFTVSEITGLYDKNSWSWVLLQKMLEGNDRQLTIDRVFEAIFDSKNWIKHHYHDVRKLDHGKESSVFIKGLGVEMKKSQIIYLRDMMMRSMIRNRAIDLGIIQGIKTRHFEKGYLVNVLKITNTMTDKMDKGQVGKIQDPMALINELEQVIQNDPFMQEYNNKVLEMFENMYPYVNERYKEINGDNLRHEGKEIQENLMNLKKREQKAFFKGMPDTINIDNISRIYVPFLMDNSAYFKQDKVDVKEIIDLGVFDGMTQELSDSNGRVSVESITNVIYRYKQSVSNYYGLHRVMRDFNIVMNEKLDEFEQTTYVNNNISKKVLRFYTDLLKDMAGYKVAAKNPKVNKAISMMRRNFYKASLGLNFKVIMTQFATVINLSSIYGGDRMFMGRLMKNLYSQFTPRNKVKIRRLQRKNNFYWDRSKVSTFEIGQATKDGFDGNNAFNRFTEFLMKGITITDNMINKAFYLTLLESTNPDTGKKFTEAEAEETVKEGILRSQSSKLDITKANILRDDHEIIRIFLKFMGEPLKLVSQVYSSAKHLQLIKKLEEKGDLVNQEMDKLVIEAENEVSDIESKIEVNENLENSPEFASMETSEQKAIRKELKQLKKDLEVAQQRLDSAQENAASISKQINDTVSDKSKARAKRLAKGRIVAMLSTMSYLTVLGVAFDLVRTKGGAKERPQDEAFWWYLAKKTGGSFIDEVFGMLPFVRDAYALLAHGWDLDAIDEVSALNDFMKSFYWISQAILNGTNIKWGKTIKSVAGSLGKVLGIPINPLERLLTTSLLYIDEDTHYRYNNLFSTRNRDNIELARAIENGNEEMIEAIVERKIANRNLRISTTVMDEFKRLAGAGHEVTITGINDSFTVDGVEYIMSSDEKEKFAKVYSQADLLVQKVMQGGYYKRLNDDMKKTLIKAIFNYYYTLAKQEISGKELISDERVFRSLNQALQYFIKRSDSLFREQNSFEYKKEQAAA